MFIPEINWLAVIAAALAHQFVGALLWSPPLLGRSRMRLANRPESALMQEGPRVLLLTTPAALLTAFGMYSLLSWLAIDSNLQAVGLAVLVWLFFVATGMWGDSLMGRRPLGIYLMNLVVQCVSLVAIALTITVFF